MIKMNIYLIGYRGVGKSSVGRSLASILGRTFIDTDSELVAQAGMTISQYVRNMGWDAFRKMERSIVQQVCRHDMQVVATGGGVVLDTQNTQAMRNTGSLVWLKASPETIRKRLLNDQRSEETRPALSSKGSFNEIEEMLTQRNPYYAQAMDSSIETDALTIEQICTALVSQLSGSESLLSGDSTSKND
jgi:shikimate kinase